jgi:hypothetical protein
MEIQDFEKNLNKKIGVLSDHAGELDSMIDRIHMEIRNADQIISEIREEVKQYWLLPEQNALKEAKIDLNIQKALMDNFDDVKFEYYSKEKVELMKSKCPLCNNGGEKVQEDNDEESTSSSTSTSSSSSDNKIKVIRETRRRTRDGGIVIMKKIKVNKKYYVERAGMIFLIPKKTVPFEDFKLVGVLKDQKCIFDDDDDDDDDEIEKIIIHHKLDHSMVVMNYTRDDDELIEFVVEIMMRDDGWFNMMIETYEVELEKHYNSIVTRRNELLKLSSRTFQNIYAALPNRFMNSLFSNHVQTFVSFHEKSKALIEDKKKIDTHQKNIVKYVDNMKKTDLLINEEIESLDTIVARFESEKNMLVEEIGNVRAILEKFNEEASINKLKEFMKHDLRHICGICCQRDVNRSLKCGHTMCDVDIQNWQKEKRTPNHIICPFCFIESKNTEIRPHFPTNTD